MSGHRSERLNPLTRRTLLGGAATLLATAASGCELLDTSPAGETGSGPGGGGNRPKEAPELARLVKSGDLPPLRQRLPREPLVVEPVSEVGHYGGEWRTFIQNPGGGEVYENIGYETLARWTRDFSDIEANIATWDTSEDGTEYTLHLRQGIKWSDGEPFTTADIAFVFDDVISNEVLFPVFPEWLSARGEPGTFEAVDEYTCRFTFPAPHAFFPYWLARAESAILCGVARHYFEQFHPKYNDDVEAEAKREKFADWNSRYWAMGGGGPGGLECWQNPDMPVLLPWMVDTPLLGNRLVARRNPYYWKTDPEGSQLPYLDRVTIEVVQSAETAVLRTTQGEFTLPSTDVLTPTNKPVFARSRAGGDYEFVDQMTSDVNNGVMVLNLTHKDPVLREVFRNRDFRIGLSHAINRQELIDAVYQRQGEPYQSAPRPESDYYDEQLAKQYTEFDVALANEHLDRSGYTDRDDDGYRLLPDGRRIRINVEMPSGFDPTYPVASELIRDYWAEVGVDLRIKNEGSALFWERLFANEHDAVIYTAESGLRDAILDPGWFFPVGGRCYYARSWADWYGTRGESGERPPEAVRQQMEIYDEINATMDVDRQRELFMEILGISREQFYVIGTALIEGRYSIVQNRMGNVLNPIPEGSLYPDPAPIGPEQFYVRS